MDARVEDYLNDKLQTLADFETLDALIANLQTQHKQLSQQLRDAEQQSLTTASASESHAESIREKVHGFEAKKADIDRRLEIVTHSETSDDAVAQFEQTMRSLQSLDVATAYIETLEKADHQGALAASKIEEEPTRALDAYQSLFHLESSLGSLQAVAEGAGPHLLDQVAKTLRNSRAIIKAAFASQLQRTLDKVLWPKPGVPLPDNLRQDFEDACTKLIALQKPELQASQADDNVATVILYPLELLVKPLVQRFQFHFSGDRPTNRPDKPEYVFSHFLDTLDAHAGFMTDHVQPVLIRAFYGTTLGQELLYIDAISAFITALLPMLRDKLSTIVKQIWDQPKLLSHLVHELQGFDNTLRTEWKYEPLDPATGQEWQGITHEILSQGGLFEHWLKVEKDFALGRYEAIISDQSAGSLDFDSVSPVASKPTKHAIRVHDLLAAVTDHYRSLMSFSQKLRFLIDIQISIFDQFHNRLHSGLEAYLSLTSSIGRTVQGASAADVASLQGTGGLDRLCRIFGSSEYLEKAMLDWSEDIFFLDLWTELQTRAQAGGAVAGDLGVKDVALRTSASLTTSADEALDTGAEGALFDETASAYGKLRARAEKVMSDTIVNNLKEALRLYSRSVKMWSTNDSADTDTDISPSADLAAALNLLSSNLGFLQKALSPLALRRIGRGVAKFLDQWLIDHIVFSSKFTLGGAVQFGADVGALAAALGPAGSGLAHAGDAVILLNLDANPTDKTAPDVTGQLGLGDVEQRLFANNDSARDVLEALGLDALPETEARRIVKCRIEVQG